MGKFATAVDYKLRSLMKFCSFQESRSTRQLSSLSIKGLNPGVMSPHASTLSNPTSARMEVDTDVLAVHTTAGIEKRRLGKNRRGKGRRSQRLRQEKGVARALLVGERTEKKVEKSKAKGKKVVERRVGHDLQQGNLMTPTLFYSVY